MLNPNKSSKKIFIAWAQKEPLKHLSLCGSDNSKTVNLKKMNLNPKLVIGSRYYDKDFVPFDQPVEHFTYGIFKFVDNLWKTV